MGFGAPSNRTPPPYEISLINISIILDENVIGLEYVFISKIN